MSDQAIQPPKVKQVYGQVYMFRLRQHKGPNFSGLWELAMLSPHGKVEKVISDADALPYCLENMQGEIENDGF